MDHKNKNDNEDKKNVLHFPELEKRASLEQKKKREEKESAKAQKEREALEEQYRQEYRNAQAQRAKNLSHSARQSASGPAPFINWDKVPPFSAAMVLIFVVIHAGLYFLVSDSDHMRIMLEYGFVPARYTVADGFAISSLIAPFSTLFLHQSFMHVLMNGFMMLVMGSFFERQFGAKRTFIFFLFAGMAGNLVYFALGPSSTIPVVGASGAISGLFAATMMVMISQGMMGPALQKRGPLPFILLWTMVLLITGLLSADVAWQSHIGGFWGGALIFRLWKTGKLRF